MVLSIDLIEVWRPIKGYQGYYEVSNIGRIKSLTRYVKSKKPERVKVIYSRNMKQKLNKTGYWTIMLMKNLVHKFYLSHRLVAQSFLSNPNNYPCVNHIDGDKLNNKVDNLEWCTHSENVMHSYNMGLQKRNNPNVIRANKLKWQKYREAKNANRKTA